MERINNQAANSNNRELMNKFIKKNCLLCNSSISSVYIQRVVHNCKMLKNLNIEGSVNSKILKCLECGHHYLSPVIEESLIKDYYNRINSEYYDYIPTHARFYEDEKILKAVLTVKSTGRVLEIGCGNGFLLNLFKKNGFDCVGIEPSPKASEYARNVLKLNVINSFLSNETFPQKSFDIILLMDVLEHVYQPLELFNQCNRILNNSGIIVVLTGDISSLNARLWKNKWCYSNYWEHISFFNRTSIDFLLCKTNFKLLSYKKFNHTGSTLSNIYKFFIHNPLMYIYNFILKRKFKHVISSFDHMLVIAEKK
jgi:2-polyprenyl-3-methyl-5-hydroxy-6-metoxy-1,4-benzoquinol methylase